MYIFHIPLILNTISEKYSNHSPNTSLSGGFNKENLITLCKVVNYPTLNNDNIGIVLTPQFNIHSLYSHLLGLLRPTH